MNGLLRPIRHPVTRVVNWPSVHINRMFSSAAFIPQLLPCLLAVVLALAANSVVLAAEPIDPVALFRSGKYAECIDVAAKAITTSEFQESPRILKLRAEMELGRYSDAAETLDAALKKFPNSIELRWWGRDVYRFNNQSDRAAAAIREIEELVQKSPWNYSNAPNRIIVGKFLLQEGVDPKKVLDGAFNIIKKQMPSYVPAYLASGQLALDKNDFALAAQSFEQAVKLDETEPEAHFGLAQAFAPSEPEKAEEALKATLKLNPSHVGALLMGIDELIDSERYDEADAVLLDVVAVNPHHPRAAAYRAILSHLRNQPDKEKTHREAGLKYWPTNPEVDHLIGRKLSQKYRFAEGAAHQRAALKFDPKYLAARIQLSQDLLRLGLEEEGWKLADEVYQADGYNIVAHNLVTLQASVGKFRTLEEDGIVARMDAREADIYGRRVLDLLRKAKTTLCKKYDIELKAPIIVEMFPKQEDFAIRTFGLPGGAGFLGVCFGTVITANSPASQGGSPSCWESTLWHEFCHVVTLNKTHNRMPRWLSEGISVYEERQANPTWGQRINPHFRKMLLGDELTPVDKLSGAFLHPATPQHLQFAYFESSLVVEFLIDKHGLETLKKILSDLGQGITINDALDRHTGSLAELNQTFVAYARQQAESMASDADWSEPELPRRTDPAQALAWLKAHPKNYAGLRMLARQLVAAKQWEAAKEPLAMMRQLYPQDAGDDSLYPMLAHVHRELKETAEERAALEELARYSDDNVDMLARLAELTSQANEWELARGYAQRWLAINPLMPAPHRIAADAAEHLSDHATAINSYRALLLLDPIDTADLHLRLATALQHTGELAAAKRHALLAVEEAPRFRAAHRKLLAILRQTQNSPTPSAEEPPQRPAEPPLPESETASP